MYAGMWLIKCFDETKYMIELFLSSLSHSLVAHAPMKKTACVDLGFGQTQSHCILIKQFFCSQ